MSDQYVGEIRMAAFNFAPVGWAQCMGQLMSIAQNQALFSLVGTMYGGNGQITFGLPDLRGRSPVGAGQGLGMANIVQGEQGGAERVTLNIANMPAHTHVATVGNVSATAPVAIPVASHAAGVVNPSTTSVLGAGTEGTRPVQVYSEAASNTTLKPFNVTVTGSGPSVTNAVAGGSLPVPTRAPYLGLNCIIALQGIYPPRQ